MKSKLAIAVLALVLTACGSPSEPTSGASASMPAQSTLSEWMTKAGLATSLKTLSTSLSGLSNDVGAVDPTDVKALANAIAKRGPELLAVANDIAAEPATNDAAYEALREATAFTIKTFANLANGLNTVADAERLTAVNNAIAAISPMNQALKPLSDYLAAHGSDDVGPAN